MAPFRLFVQWNGQMDMLDGLNGQTASFLAKRNAVSYYYPAFLLIFKNRTQHLFSHEFLQRHLLPLLYPLLTVQDGKGHRH